MKATKILWKGFLFIISLIIIVGVLFNSKMLPYTIPTLIILIVLIFLLYKFAKPLFDKLFGWLKIKTPEVTKSISDKTSSYMTQKTTDSRNKKLDLNRLEELHSLVEKGVLTQEEFEQKKKEML